MRRMIVTTVLTCVSLLALAPSTFAADHGWWGWLEEFSGPGEFRGPILGASSGQMLCFVRSREEGFIGTTVLEAGNPAGEETSIKAFSPCIYVDGRFYHAREGRGFPATNAFLVDGGFAVSWRGLASVGGGPGALHLVSDAPAGSIHTTRFTTSARATVSPVRIAWELVDLAGGDDAVTSPRWAGVVKLFYKQTYVFGRLSGADFGVTTPCDDCGNEWQESWGISFDFLELRGIGLN